MVLPALVGIGQKVLGGAIAASVFVAIQEPIKNVLGQLIPTQDAALRNVMAAASAGLIDESVLTSSSAFQKLDEGDKQVTLAIVRGNKVADIQAAKTKAKTDARKAFDKLVSTYDDEVHKPLIKKIDKLSSETEKVDKSLADLVLDRTDYYAKLDIGVLSSALTTLQAKANRQGLIV